MTPVASRIRGLPRPGEQHRVSRRGPRAHQPRHRRNIVRAQVPHPQVHLPLHERQVRVGTAVRPQHEPRGSHSRRHRRIVSQNVRADDDAHQVRVQRRLDRSLHGTPPRIVLPGLAVGDEHHGIQALQNSHVRGCVGVEGAKRDPSPRVRLAHGERRAQLHDHPRRVHLLTPGEVLGGAELELQGESQILGRHGHELVQRWDLILHVHDPRRGLGGPRELAVDDDGVLGLGDGADALGNPRARAALLLGQVAARGRVRNVPGGLVVLVHG
mmetsp:Transcript_8202/g.32332  ORF Transcript_8202/g.32332 Transcript_8202/m.32332 type:complete len:270 (+) Transcript_8202:2115-2924(+)